MCSKAALELLHSLVGGAGQSTSSSAQNHLFRQCVRDVSVSVGGGRMVVGVTGLDNPLDVKGRRCCLTLFSECQPSFAPPHPPQEDADETFVAIRLARTQLCLSAAAKAPTEVRVLFEHCCVKWRG